MPEPDRPAGLAALPADNWPANLPAGLAGQMAAAWQVRRQHHPPQIWFAAPSTRHYENQYYANAAASFATISVTGTSCACQCDHCGGKLLATMIQAPTPAILRRQIQRLADQGCRGVLISGGADRCGEVPVRPFLPEIAYAVSRGLRVLVHTGLVSRDNARALRAAGVDQVLVDVIGDQATIREVYHLDRRPEDYLASLQACGEAGLPVAPHLVVGLHYGRLAGEMAALQMIRETGPQSLVLVVLTPKKGTAMAGVEPPAAAAVAGVIAAARLLLPDIPVNLGCARPAGPYKETVEAMALACGVNGIAYPAETTVAQAIAAGLQPRFSDLCCSLLGIG